MTEITEITTRPNAQLPDAQDLDMREKEDTLEEKEQKTVTLWTRRFNRSETYRRPYIEKNLRMYRLYRSYRQAVNYAYGTSIMPPTGFEIIETVKPRLASAKIKANIYPRLAENVDHPGIAKWDDLVEYNFQEAEFDDKKIDWVGASLTYGNGILQFMWDGTSTYIEVVDNWLFYPDPKAGKRLKNSRWEIKQSFKSKAELEKDEKERGDNPLYTHSDYKIDEETGKQKEQSLIESDKWKKIEDEQPKTDDPRRQRYEINTLKMGQIDDGRKRGQTANEGESQTNDKDVGDRNIEIWECFDHIEGKLIVIFNRKIVVRDEDNPYADINNGQCFIDLPDISVLWEYYAMGHLEPVETTIHEIADSRNQAMDDIVFSLDPIRKIRKGAGYKASDFKHSPGASWWVKNSDDITFERMPEVSRAWVEKDNILRREIQTSLALSEYTQGSPKSPQEPASKVELLLMQTNIRFSLLVRQMEIALTELTNAIIEMNQKWLDEDLSMRIMGKDFRFAEFKQEDKQIEVDAIVEIKPIKEKSPEQESKEVLEMYKMFVVDDKPEGGSPKEVAQWKKKKNTLQRLIVEKLDYEEYIDILAPKYEEEEEPPQQPKAPPPGPQGGSPIKIPSGPAQGLADNPVPNLLNIPGPEPIMEPEGAVVPQVTNPQTAPRQGFLQELLKRFRGNA